MKKLCDLHTHSYYSDGTASPSEIIDLAVKNGISAVALSDHNTVGGVREFINYASQMGVEAVGGCEISTEYKGIELHVLALFIPENKYDTVTEFLKPMLKRKRESNRILVENLNKGGYDVDFDKLVAESPEGHFNRANIAGDLVKKGYVENVKQAFSSILSKTAGFYNPPKRIDSFEAIEFIKGIGAVPVLAHPFLDLNEGQLREFLSVAVGHGLCGMETKYASFSDEESALASKIAKEFGVLESGGSDFHGAIRPGVTVGLGRGNLQIPYEFYLNLRNVQKN